MQNKGKNMVTNTLMVDVVKPIVLSFRKNITDGYNPQQEVRLFLTPELKKAYQEFITNEVATADSRLKECIKELGTIYDPVNVIACADCKRDVYINDSRKKVLPIGCCVDCWNQKAHFRWDGLKGRAAFFSLTQKYNWGLMGFWTPHGCKLPRELRSLTCLEHTCDKLNSKLTEEQRKRRNELIEEIQRLKSILKPAIK
jgi:hypothetical protein